MSFHFGCVLSDCGNFSCLLHFDSLASEGVLNLKNVSHCKVSLCLYHHICDDTYFQDFTTHVKNHSSVNESFMFLAIR